MSVELTAAAEADLAAIYASHAARSGATAESVLGTVLRAINGLALFPLMGRPGLVPETRERFVTRYPYRILYHLHEAAQAIEVWRVVHGAQAWPPGG